jgi:hypothetical protein
MSGVDGIMIGSTSPPSERETSPTTTADSIQVVDNSILSSLSDRYCITKEGVKFNHLTVKERKQFYHEVVQEILSCVSRNLTANVGAYRVASAYNISILNCDRGRIKPSVNKTDFTALR